MLRLGHHQQGITLLESLIAILVMALGILGVLGVQLRTLSDTQTGVRRAQAIRLIEDLSERMKANPNALAHLESYVTDWTGAPEFQMDCTQKACKPDELTAFDRAQWKQSVKALLPGGNAKVFLAPGEPSGDNRRQLGVMISWRENEHAATADYGDPLDTTGDSGESCPAGRTCHLQFIPVSARCAPYFVDVEPQFHCPGG